MWPRFSILWTSDWTAHVVLILNIEEREKCQKKKKRYCISLITSLLGQNRYLRITSTLYVALICPTRLKTWQVYFPLSSGLRLLRLSVHFFFLFSPISWVDSGLLSFSQVISGLGFPLAMHLSRTELPTGRAMTLFLILAGCVNRGRAVKKKMD